MLKPTKNVKEYEKYGFKKCKGDYGKNRCYYLCVNRGQQMIFLSKEMIDIFPWENNDPRIHKNPNCKYKDQRTALDIVCLLVMQNLVEVVI